MFSWQLESVDEKGGDGVLEAGSFFVVRSKKKKERKKEAAMAPKKSAHCRIW